MAGPARLGQDRRSVRRASSLALANIEPEGAENSGRQRELEHRAEIFVVQQLVVFLFLMHKMQHESPPVHVVETEIPLVELAAIKLGPVRRSDLRPDVLVVALGVHGQEIARGCLPGSEIVQRPNDVPALAVLPRWVANPEVAGVRIVSVGRTGWRSHCKPTLRLAVRRMPGGGPF